MDAHEHFLGVGVLFLQVVAVVGGHQGHVQLPGQGHQPGQHDTLLPDAVVHDLDEEILLAEDVLHLPHIGHGVLVPVLEEQLGQVPGQAGGEADQPLAVLPDQLVVHARLVIIAREEALGAQVHQVLVAGVVFAQQNQVAVLPAHIALVRAVPADIGLAADDRVHPRVLHGRIKVNNPVHHAVIGDGAAVHAQGLEPLHQFGDAAGAVQQAVFRMQMQVCKTHPFLPRRFLPPLSLALYHGGRAPGKDFSPGQRKTS